MFGESRLWKEGFSSLWVLDRQVRVSFLLQLKMDKKTSKFYTNKRLNLSILIIIDLTPIIV